MLMIVTCKELAYYQVFPLHPNAAMFHWCRGTYMGGQFCHLEDVYLLKLQNCRD